MYKNTIFVYEFVRNLLKYKKIKIKKLQIWTGEICTLRCKNCSQLFPYIKPQIPIYDINSVIEYTKNLMKYCEIESFHIIGGEPFLNKEIWKLVEFVCNQEHKNINKIISNGTILPEKRTMEILAKYKNDIIINISEYKCAEEKQKNFINLCKEFNVNYSIESQNWYYCGNPEQKEIKDPKEVKANFKACWDRSCTTFANGELSICPRMYNSYKVYNHTKPFIENLDLKHIFYNQKIPNLVIKSLIATCLSAKVPREACKYCYGVSARNKLYCKRGEQLIKGESPKE